MVKKDAAAADETEVVPGEQKQGDEAPGETQTEKVEAATEEEGDQNSDPGDWTPEQKAYLEKLRKENAKFRTRSKELDSKYSNLNTKFSKIENGLKSLFGEGEGSETDPEVQVSQLTEALQAKDIQHSITELAYDHAVPKEDKEYFEYLMMKRLQNLGEDEELGEDDIAEIAKQAKARKGAGASSVGTGDKPNGAANPTAITLAQFKKMSITEKSALYGKNPKLYESLTIQAKENRQSL